MSGGPHLFLLLWGRASGQLLGTEDAHPLHLTGRQTESKSVSQTINEEVDGADGELVSLLPSAVATLSLPSIYLSNLTSLCLALSCPVLSWPHLVEHRVVAAVDLVAPVHVPRAQEGALSPPQELHLVCRGVRAHYLEGRRDTQE